MDLPSADFSDNYLDFDLLNVCGIAPTKHPYWVPAFCLFFCV